MRISSFNVTDVGYHYIGLRVISSLSSTVKRDEQLDSIARGVLKYVSEKSLRLLLPEPNSSFETVGRKICEELVHFGFITPVRVSAYVLTPAGVSALALLNQRQFVDLRRLMVRVHLETYDNLRYLVQRHLEEDSIWRPVVESDRLQEKGYFERLLRPSLGDKAEEVIESLEEKLTSLSSKKVEDILSDRILRHLLPDYATSVSLFRALADRLASLRLLNVTRVTNDGCNFLKSYSTALACDSPLLKPWHHQLSIETRSGEPFRIALCEPEMGQTQIQKILIGAIETALGLLLPQAGFYDLPDVRSFVCEQLRLPEAAFDEGLNLLLDLTPPPFSVGLRYEGISGYRKPLIRTRGSTQIYNLIRK